MARFLPTALLLVLVVVAFKSVISIKCYVCRSDKTAGCAAKPLNASLVQECPIRPNAIGHYCRKIEQQLYFKQEKSVTTIRECAYEKERKQCYLTDWSSAAYMQTCECDKDLCNGSPRVGASGVVVAAASIVSLPFLVRFICELYRT